MVEKIHALTDRAGPWQETTEFVDKLNRTLRGWANYFQVEEYTHSDLYFADPVEHPAKLQTLSGALYCG